MNLLREISDCVMQDSEYECALIRKPKMPAMAAAVSEENKKRTFKRFMKTRDTKTQRPNKPLGHILNPPRGFPCVNERETGKCKLPNCKASHNFKGSEDVECKHSSYVKCQVCPGFLPGRRKDETFCKRKHSKNPVEKELAAKREQRS